MSTIIKIKNSGVSGSPSALATGELAYSYLTGTLSNGGDRLYIGTGTEDSLTGAAANIEVIGGTYFTSKLDHTPGTLTASSALIVDANSKIDIFNVDNLRLDGNTISSTDANGDINVTPNGTGDVNITTLGDISLTGTNLNISGILNNTGDVEITGNLHATGTLDIDSQATLASLNVEDLTSTRIVFAGALGELTDSANLTFDGTSFIVGTNKFTVAHATGNTQVVGTLNVDGQSTLASLNVEDLTNNRVLIAGATGEVEDDANFTFDGTELNIGVGNFTVQQASGNTQVVGTLNVDGQSTLASLNVEDLTATRVVYVGASGELVDSADMVFTGSGATSQLQLIGKLNVDAQTTLASLNVEDLTSGRVTFAGASGELVDSANFTFDSGTNLLSLTGDQDIIGSLDVDNVNINGNTISATNANGNIELTPNALGLTVINSATALTIPVGNTASRPGTPTTGMIRYNSTDSRYEGYSSGVWQGLGGVIDVDQNTYIIAETSPGANNNDLEFYTDGVKRVNLDENGMVFTDATIPLQVGKIVIQDDTISSTTGGVIYIDPNPAGSAGSVVIEGNLTVNGTQTIVNSTTVSIDDPVFNLGGDTVPTVNDGLDKGIAFQWYDTAAHVGFFGWDLSDERFKFIPDATDTSGTFSGTLGDVAFKNALLDSITFSAGNYTSTSVLVTDGSGNVGFANEDAASVYGVTGQVLQMNASGVPTFGHIDCGTY
jgi:hypothetical protein